MEHPNKYYTQNIGSQGLARIRRISMHDHSFAHLVSRYLKTSSSDQLKFYIVTLNNCFYRILQVRTVTTVSDLSVSPIPLVDRLLIPHISSSQNPNPRRRAKSTDFPTGVGSIGF